MRSFIFYLMVVLMIVWTAVFIMELSYVYFSSTAVAAMAGTEQSVADFGWGLPMVVLAIISAVTQPAPR
jgi:hypothetical protein